MQTVKDPDSREETITRMVTLYQLPLLRLCTMYLHDEEQAKDAVQETFLKACRHWNSFRGEAAEKTWLTRIAINVCKNYFRTAWFRRVDRRVTPDMMAERLTGEQPQDNAVTLALMNLPVKLREAALLVWLEGMTYQEAAGVLNISHQAVGSRLNRARKKLRFAMEGRDEDGTA